MTDTDKPEEPDPLLNPDGTRKPDLRYGSRDVGNVRIDRSLDASGHLARGDKTHMSVLNFSARAKPRTERDPEFEFRPPAAPPPAAEEAPAPPAAGAEPAPADPSGEPPTGPERPAPDPVRESDRSPSLLGRVKKMFGR